MQIVTRENPTQEIKLPTIHLSTQELVEVIERTCGDKPVTLVIGRRFDDSYTILENLEEIKQHQSSISIPFSFDVEETRVEFNRYGAHIVFPNESSVLARSLEKRLSEFKPWYLFIFAWWFPGIWFAPVPLAAMGEIQFFQSKELTWLIMALWTMPALFSFFGGTYYRTRIDSKERQGFFRRNLDKVLMLLLSLALGTLIANFDKIIPPQSKQPAAEETQKQ